MTLSKLISGGQTGADRGGLEAALYVSLPHGGWRPKPTPKASIWTNKGYQLDRSPADLSLSMPLFDTGLFGCSMVVQRDAWHCVDAG